MHTIPLSLLGGAITTSAGGEITTGHSAPIITGNYGYIQTGVSAPISTSDNAPIATSANGAITTAGGGYINTGLDGFIDTSNGGSLTTGTGALAGPDTSGTIALIDPASGTQTFSGAQTFSGQVELTNQAATNATSVMTRALGDIRYGETVFAIKTADTTKQSDTSYADDPHMVVALTAGTWEIEVVQSWVAADGTGGMKGQLNYSGTLDTTAGFVHNKYIYHTTNAVTDGAAYSSFVKGGFSNPIPMLRITQRSGHLVLSGCIVVTTAGNLSFQWAQNASSATATTLPKGCYIRARRVA